MDEITLPISLPLEPRPTFEADVVIELPGRDRQQAMLRLEFFHRDRAELEDIDRRYLDRATPPERADGDLLEAIARRWIIGPVGEDGQAVAWSRSAIDRVLRTYPALLPEIYATYQRELREARRGNS